MTVTGDTASRPWGATSSPSVVLRLTFVVLILFPVAQLQPFRSGRTLHSSPSRHGCIWHHHFCSTIEAVRGQFQSVFRPQFRQKCIVGLPTDFSNYCWFNLPTDTLKTQKSDYSWCSMTKMCIMHLYIWTQFWGDNKLIIDHLHTTVYTGTTPHLLHLNVLLNT